jgi:diguanylate cyclase (GGDEF)-like protein
LNEDLALLYIRRVDQRSARASFFGILHPEIVGSLAVLAAALLFGIAALYVLSLSHRKEQRGALAYFVAMLASDEGLGAVPANPYHFLEAASDVVAVGNRLAPGDACVGFLSTQIHEINPDLDLATAQDTIRRFCNSRGRHVEVEPVGQSNVVLALRPVHLENGMGANIVTFAVAPIPSLLILRNYPRLLAIIILFSLVCAGAAFWWIRGSRRQLREFARRAEVDGLTGALRRESFTENLDLAIKQASATATPLCIAVLDLDNLKPINDRHGHTAGDEALRQLVIITRAHLRTADVIGRLGGDEFAVLLAGATRTAAGAIAENIREAFDRASRVGASVSIGLAELQPDDNSERIVRRADERMYAAKQTRSGVTLRAQPAPPPAPAQ